MNGQPSHLAIIRRAHDAMRRAGSGHVVELLYVLLHMHLRSPAAPDPRPLLEGASIVAKVGGQLTTERLTEEELAALVTVLDMLERRLGRRKPPAAAPGRTVNPDTEEAP